MIAVIFEVVPKADRKQDYLEIAAEAAAGAREDRRLFFPSSGFRA